MKKTDSPIIVRHEFPVEPRTLWHAITDPSHMKHWFFKEIPNFIPAVGFSTEFEIQLPERTFTHLWRIVDVVEFRKIVYDWSYREYPGRGRVVFQIEKTEKGSRLTLINEVSEDFHDDIPEFQRSSCQGGWEYFIQQQLPAYLTKTNL